MQDASSQDVGKKFREAAAELDRAVIERDRYRAALEEIVRLNDAVVADLAREALNGGTDG